MFGICLPNYYICNRNEKKIKQVNINLTIFKEMNKKLFFLAIAALGLAACSNDDVVEINQGESISFRPLTTNVTRAADVDFETNGFYVTALKQGQTPSSENTYFDNVHFEGSSTYTSTNKYYWPSAYNLDFYAYSPAAEDGTDVVRTNYKTFVITSNGTVGNQVDFVYANTNDWGKADLQVGTDASHAMGAVDAGVAINFRHAESKVIINLKNTNPNVKFTVGQVTIGNLYNKGTFTYAATNTDVKNSGHLTNAMWSDLLTGAAATRTASFEQTIAEANSGDYSTSTSAQAGVDMILIPQTLVNADAYDAVTPGTPAVNDPFNGAYIKVKLRMQNNNNNAYIIGTSSTWQECMWPLASLQWQPGYKYIYEVDLAGGGYFPANNDADANLDPILEGAEIKFVTVTVDDWTNYASNPIEVSAP